MSKKVSEQKRYFIVTNQNTKSFFTIGTCMSIKDLNQSYKDHNQPYKAIKVLDEYAIACCYADHLNSNPWEYNSYS